MRQSNGRIYKNSTREAHGKVDAILKLGSQYDADVDADDDADDDAGVSVVL